MALKRKNRIMTFAMTAVIALSLAGGLYSGRGRLDEAYDELKYFFVSADPDVVFYNEATRTTINYEVEDKEPSDNKSADDVSKEEFDKINDAYVSEYFLDYLSAAEQKLIELYRAAASDDKKLATRILKGEKLEISDLLPMLMASGAGGEDGLLGGLLGKLQNLAK